jgi:isopentenyl-diphosphate delta-isomerase
MSTPDATGTGETENAATGGTEREQGEREQVVAVDSEDREQGLVGRLEAHTGEGVRHRAFTVLVYDEEGRILLARRSPAKRLWDTFWDGTVASHPAPGQSQLDATRKRLEEELGIAPDQYDDLRETDVFEYKRFYLDEGLEYEVCTVLKVTLSDVTTNPDPEEVAGLLWVSYDDLHEHPKRYRQLRLCPWFEIAMRRDHAEEPS